MPVTNRSIRRRSTLKKKNMDGTPLINEDEHKTKEDPNTNGTKRMCRSSIKLANAEQGFASQELLENDDRKTSKAWTIKSTIEMKDLVNNQTKFKLFRNVLLLAILSLLLINASYFVTSIGMSVDNQEIDQRMLLPTFLRFGTKPLLVLHVGPGNAGTKSIQTTLGSNEKILQSDSYKYIGNEGGILSKSKSYQCTTNETKCEPTLSAELIELLAKENQNLFGSNPNLGKLDDDQRKAWTTALGDKWDMKIVVTYRRLHGLLLSNYIQQYKKNRKSKEKLDGHRSWPGKDRDIKIPTFPEYLAREVDLNVHASKEVYETWKGKDDKTNVSIFNVHQEGNRATNFVCQAIPGANNLCQGLTNNPEEPGKDENEANAIQIDFDIMAVHAYENNLLHEFDNDRFEVKEAIRKHYQQMHKQKRQLPQTCPDQKTLDKLFSASLKFETWASQFGGASKPVTDFKASWDETLKDNKLCSVNAAAAFEKASWKEFIRLRYSVKAMEAFYQE